MTTSRPSADLVRPPTVPPREGALPAECTDVTARELGSIAADGTLWRGVMIGWRYADQTHAAKAFMIYYRRADSDTWRLLAQAGGGTRTHPCYGFFQTDARYVFAVIAVGPACCAKRPPDATDAVVHLTFYGDEPLPPAPTNLRLEQVGEAIYVKWDPVEYVGLPLYEVRLGEGRITEAEILGHTPGTLWPLSGMLPLGKDASDPSLEVMVTALSPTGRRGGIARLSGKQPEWGFDGNMGTALLYANSNNWNGGALDGLDDTANGLTPTSPTASTGTWQSGPVDLGSLAKWEFRPWMHVIVTYCLTPRMSWFSPNSPLGKSRSPNGGASEIDYPLPDGVGWSPNSIDKTPNGSGALTPSSQIRTGGWSPSMAWFTPNAPMGTIFTPNGFVSTAALDAVLEWRTSEDGSTYTDWEEAAAGMRYCRYVEWRITVTSVGRARGIVVKTLRVQTREAGKAWTPAFHDNETPSGTINGVNDTFTVSATPDPATFMLWKNGVLMQNDASGDYTLSGSTITYDPGSIPSGSDWHVCSYREQP